MSRILLPACLATLALSAPAQDDKQVLTVQAKTGAPVHLRLTQTQVQTIEAMGQEMTNETAMDIEVQVTEATAEGVTADVTWRRIRGKLGSMMGEMEFDSQDKELGADDPMLGGVVEAIASLAGQKVTVVIAPSGEVRDVKGLDEMLAAAQEKASGPGAMLVQGLLSKEALRRQLQLFGRFSAEPVAVGGTWTKSDDESGGRMPVHLATTSKLEEITAEVIRISFSGTVDSVAAKEGQEEEGGDDEGAAQMRAMLRDAKIKDGKIQGETKISRQDGVVLSSKAETSMGIEMANPMGGDEPFRVGVKQTSTIERIAAEPAKGEGEGKKRP